MMASMRFSKSGCPYTLLSSWTAPASGGCSWVVTQHLLIITLLGHSHCPPYFDAKRLLYMPLGFCWSASFNISVVGFAGIGLAAMMWVEWRGGGGLTLSKTIYICLHHDDLHSTSVKLVAISPSLGGFISFISVILLVGKGPNGSPASGPSTP